MNQEPHKREQGELELRILKDGRLVVIVPDEALLEVARAVGGEGIPAPAEFAAAEDSAPHDPQAHPSCHEGSVDETSDE